jgi:hypothetical protein
MQLAVINMQLAVINVQVTVINVQLAVINAGSLIKEVTIKEKYST